MRDEWIALSIFVLLLLGASCSFVWHPHPSSPPTFTPTPSPTPTTTPTATATSTPSPTPTRLYFLTPTPVGTPTLLPGQVRIRLTDEEALALLSSTVELPVEYTNVGVHFRGDGRIELWADDVRYGFIRLRNFHLIGRIELVGCIPQLVIEHLEPDEILTTLIPSLINRTLRQSAQGYCVEEVRVQEGEMVLLMRGR